MELRIRQAYPDDYESLVPLFRQVHDLHVDQRPDLYKENPSTVEREVFLNQITDSKQHIYVASSGTEIHAVVVMREEEISANSFVKTRDILVIDSLCVSENKRNQGVGRVMMEFVLEFGIKLNVDSVELGVSESNPSAIRFYESIGFNTKSRKMEFRLKEGRTNLK